MTAETENIKTVIEALKANRFDVIYREDAESAAKQVIDLIPAELTVGTGGSMTVRQLGLREELVKRGNIQTFQSGQVASEQRRLIQGDVFLTSSNAVTLDGKLVNIDSSGNRVARMIYGPPKVILVIGQNKIVGNVDEAIKRVKYVIAPYHGKTMKIQAPCAVDGICSDCKAPGRICNITTILEKKPRMSEFTIIMVGEDLGLGWDPDWPEERKQKIAAAYEGAWQRERADFPPRRS